MLMIRQSQMHALWKSRFDAFIADLAATAPARVPSCTSMPGPALLALLASAVEMAAAYGIEDVDDVVPFTDLAVAHGLAFTERVEFAWARAILQDTELSGSVKVAVLFSRLPAALEPV